MASFDADEYDEPMLLSLANDCADYQGTCNLARTMIAANGTATYRIVVKRALELAESEKDAVFTIFETNMKAYYEQTFGWKPVDKKKELFHPDSKYVFVYNDMTSPSPSLVAYAMFRFEWDDDEEPEHPVLYCYELQVDGAARGQQVGSQIMDMLHAMAAHWRMWKVMLTCFKVNTPAMAFYTQKKGFKIDNNSPSTCGYNDETYEILSIRVKLAK